MSAGELEKGKAYTVLAMNTLAFAACFAVWVMYGVLITFLVDTKVMAFDKAQMGWLIGIPILTGSLFRLPVGMLTDRLGGRAVFTVTMLVAAVATFFTSFASTFWGFALCGLGFGLAGASFAAGVAYTSVWFPKERQGTALGIFGTGNAGAGLASIFAPKLLGFLTENGARMEGWRDLPRLYAGGLVLMAGAFFALTTPKKPEVAKTLTMRERLAPLKVVRVWRFGLYYFVLFGGFVALASWLIPYYVNVYGASVATAGTLAAIFSLPTGLVRALGGWLSDRFGARTVMYFVLSGCAACFLLLAVPRMDVYAPGEGVMAAAAGTVDRVDSDQVVVNGTPYKLTVKPGGQEQGGERGMLVWPAWRFWQEPVVALGDHVAKRQLLARGVTHVYFQANMTIFTGLAFLAALFMGTGMAAVYKHIPTYFPKEVGVVGGLVGVIGGLGGFFCPILFGYLLRLSGIWTTCWVFFFALSVVCLAWMHRVAQKVMSEGAPQLAEQIETPAIVKEIEHMAREMEALAGRLRRQGEA